MGAGSKISALIKVVKTWVAANKVAAGILAGVFVAGGGTAVALGDDTGSGSDSARVHPGRAVW